MYEGVEGEMGFGGVGFGADDLDRSSETEIAGVREGIRCASFPIRSLLVTPGHAVKMSRQDFPP